MRFAKTAAALCLALCLAVPAWAAPSQPQAEQRREDLDFLYETMRDYHPNLFANTPESEFLARKGEIEAALDRSDDVTFALDLQSLIALAGDSHTSAALGQILTVYDMIPVGLDWMEGRWVLSAADEQYAGLLGWTVTGVNGFSMDQVQQKLSLLLSADNEVKLRRQVGQLFGVEDFFLYCGLAEKGRPWTLEVEGPEGQTRTLTIPLVSSADQAGWPALARLADQRTGRAPTDRQDRYYFALELDSGNYYIQFNTCREDPELPMADFAAQVGMQLEAGDYHKVLIDLRSNGGGSDGVLQPLLSLLAPMVRSGQLEVWGLIGENTFSSAGINAMMIKEMGGFLAGEPAGGSVDHFGSVGSFILPNSGLRVSMSQKYIVMADYMECGIGLGVTPIQPDLYVAQTVSDFLAGRDTVVEALLARTEHFVTAEQPQAPLTRGRFVELLRRQVQAAGVDTAAVQNEFWDSFPFAWFAPGVDWAAAAGVAGGTGEGRFQASRPITRQEAAVMAVQAARLLGAGAEGAAVLADRDAVAPWALQAVQTAVARGWMEAGEGTFRPQDGLTRAEGEALAACLSAK